MSAVSRWFVYLKIGAVLGRLGAILGRTVAVGRFACFDVDDNCFCLAFSILLLVTPHLAMPTMHQDRTQTPESYGTPWVSRGSIEPTLTPHTKPEPIWSIMGCIHTKHTQIPSAMEPH